MVFWSNFCFFIFVLKSWHFDFHCFHAQLATHFLIESYEQANFNKQRTIRDCLRSVRLGKTIFLFQILLITTFYLKSDSIYYFYEDEQTKLSNIERNVNLFSQSSLDLISTHGWKTFCSFDNTCDAIFNERKLLRVATSGRNRSVSVLYVKYNLYHQLVWTQRISILSNLRHTADHLFWQTVKQHKFFKKKLRTSNIIILWTLAHGLWSKNFRLHALMLGYSTGSFSNFLSTFHQRCHSKFEKWDKKSCVC